MEALVTAAKNGDKEAFVQLIRINKQSMYKAAWVYLRNEQDIAQSYDQGSSQHDPHGSRDTPPCRQIQRCHHTGKGHLGPYRHIVCTADQHKGDSHCTDQVIG